MLSSSLGFELYLITAGEGHKEGGRDALIHGVKAALEGGVRAVQLREKGLCARQMLETAKELRVLTRSYGARLFINDRLDITLLAGADGVHLTSGGLKALDVRRYLSGFQGWQRGLLIGVSTHTLEQAEEAEYGGADFVTFGPVYATPSKMPYGSPVGLDRLAEVTASVQTPVFAIGGINPQSVTQVMVEKKATGVAVISYILSAKDIRANATELNRAIQLATDTGRS